MQAQGADNVRTYWLVHSFAYLNYLSFLHAIQICKDGTVLVGEAALEAAATEAANTFYSIKRLIGRPFSHVQVIFSLNLSTCICRS